ncbi:TetR/AcrR family transcriptional regulator [Isoptericola halotolerans]|uniref:TetR/AcrR family transcriptional regulator n=1 Tax=Isoptericola halotolerans TaxID=300560 RepID=UPI0031B5FBB7
MPDPGGVIAVDEEPVELVGRTCDESVRADSDEVGQLTHGFPNHDICTTNYFRNRESLITGLFERIGTRLAPTPADLAARAGAQPSRELFAAYLRDIVRRLTAQREVTLALYELRLEAARRPELARLLGDWQRADLDAVIAFNEAAGLPGGRREIALFHYAIEGLVLDRLVSPIDPDTPTDEVVDALVAGLLP